MILAADRGREFAFARTEKLAGTLISRYGFEIDGDGSLVTESYEVTEPISRAGWFIIGTVYGNHDRRADLRAGMEQTLQRLRDVAESPATAYGTGAKPAIAPTVATGRPRARRAAAPRRPAGTPHARRRAAALRQGSSRPKPARHYESSRGASPRITPSLDSFATDRRGPDRRREPRAQRGPCCCVHLASRHGDPRPDGSRDAAVRGRCP